MYSLRLNLFSEVLTGAGIPLSLRQMFCCRSLSRHGAQTLSYCGRVLPSELCSSDFDGSFLSFNVFPRFACIAGFPLQLYVLAQLCQRHICIIV